MTPRFFLVAALATFAWSSASSLALAQDDDDGTAEDPEPEVSSQPSTRDPYDRLLAASATLGIDTPFGIGGLALEFSPIRYLTIYAGGGVGRDGARVAAGVRPRFPMGNGAFGLMLGVTGGPLDWDSRGLEDMRIHRYWEFALHLHGGLSFEYRWNEGFFGRLEMGIEALMTPNEADFCGFADGNSCVGVPLYKPVRAWLGLSGGYAFDL